MGNAAKWIWIKIIWELFWLSTVIPICKNLIAHSNTVLLALLGLYVAQVWIPIKDENAELRDLVPLLASRDIIQRSLAVTYARSRGLDKKFPEYFERVGAFTEQEARKMYENPQMALAQGIPNPIHYQDNPALDPKLAEIIRRTLEQEKAKSVATLHKQIEDLKGDPVREALHASLERGDELLKQKRCFSAYQSFWEAMNLNWENPAAKAGMSVASTCIEPEATKAFNELNMLINSTWTAKQAISLRNQVESNQEWEKKVYQEILKSGKGKKGH